MAVKKKTLVLHKLIHDMESEDYHRTPDTFSSSQFKTILEDEELFFKKYIEKSIEKESIGAFDVGTYFHTGILEPDKLARDCVVYPRSTRRGKYWDAFKKKYEGKCIVSGAQARQAELLMKAVKDSPIAMSYIKRGTAEVSFFVELAVEAGEIYAPFYSMVLGRDGWEKTTVKPSKKAVRIVIKVRADSLGDNFILDLKSTRGNVKNRREMKNSVSKYNYDLSAALYLDLFSLALKKPMTKFIWTFASKDYLNSRSYRASEKNVLVGRAKYRKAILKIADGLACDWTFGDCLDVLEPNAYEEEWIQESELDLV